jgi:mRNA-degrading endonuclease toxin of MazEF toxin-antitoxin module
LLILQRSPTLDGSPITTTIRDIPSGVYLTPRDGLLADCAVNMDNVQMVPKERIGSMIAYLSPERMEGANGAFALALGLDAPAFGL